MDKNNKKNRKKRFISFSVLFLCFFFFFNSSVVPFSVSAAESEDSFLNTILNFTRYSLDSKDLFFDTLNNNIKSMPSSYLFTDYNGSSVFKDTLSNDVKNQSDGSFAVGALYSMSGKARWEYSGSNSDYYDIVECAITVSDNINPVSGSVYPELPNRYTPVDFIPVDASSVDTVSHIGVYYWTFKRYNSSGLVLEESMAFQPDLMPYIVLYSNGDFGVAQRATSGYLYNSSGKSRVNILNNTLRFMVRDVNNISGHEMTGLGRPETLKTLTQYWSLDYGYRLAATMSFSNDSNYVNTINNRISINHTNINVKPPVSLIGIPARTVINNNTVNNYNDYGLSYNDDSNKINLDLGGLELAFKNSIKPIFENDWNLVYKNQPAPNSSFDTDILYDYDDYFNVPLSSNYLPEEWLQPFPDIQLQPNLEVELPSIPLYELDSGVIENSVEFFDVGNDFFEASGLLPALMFFAVAGILFLFLD